MNTPHVGGNVCSAQYNPPEPWNSTLAIHGSGTDRLLIAFVFSPGWIHNYVRFDGVDMNELFNVSGTYFVYYLKDSELPAAAGNYTFSFSHNTGGLMEYSVVELYGVNQTSTFGNYTNNNSMALNANCKLDVLVLDCIEIQEMVTLTAIAPSILVNQTITGFYWRTIGMSQAKATSVTQTMNWGSSGGTTVNCNITISISGRQPVHGPKGQNN